MDVNHRGWDFPGGHIETGESPEDCFKREAREEGYVEGECKLLGHIIVDHSKIHYGQKAVSIPKLAFKYSTK